MITKLTDEQNKQLKVYRDKWLAIGLSCEPLNKEDLTIKINKLYAAHKYKSPQIIFIQSPYDLCLLEIILSQIKFQVGDQVRVRVGGQVWDHVWARVGNQVRDRVWDQLRDRVWDQARDQIRDQIRDRVGDQVWDHLCLGQHDSAWLAYYDYFNYMGIVFSEQFNIFSEISCSCGWWIPYAKICFISERPVKISMVNKKLHNVAGPSILYSDGWAVYSLNAVRVPEWLVMTKDTDIDPLRMLEIKNAEIRREFVRKVGIDRIWYKLVKPEDILDKQGNYELGLINLGDNQKRPYLKMLNPSIDTWHVEGVFPKCKTVQQALNYRNHLDLIDIDDVNGSDWYQQGDVIVKPKGAKTYKSQPIILT